jgi:drug/metabolite transporter (DMT)-like permease
VPLAFVLDGFEITFTWGLIGSVAYIVVLGQVVAYIAALGLLRFAGVFQATLVTPLIPVFAILFAVLFLGEPLLARELAGGALIILGVITAIVPAQRLRRR